MNAGEALEARKSIRYFESHPNKHEKKESP